MIYTTENILHSFSHPPSLPLSLLPPFHSPSLPLPLPLSLPPTPLPLPSSLPLSPSLSSFQPTEEVPPPIPLKRRGKGPFSSPTHTPIRQPVDSPSSADRLLSKSVDSGGYLDQVPRIPVRIESIPGLKSALVQETPPPKPPRTDRPPSSEMVRSWHYEMLTLRCAWIKPTT